MDCALPDDAYVKGSFDIQIIHTIKNVAFLTIAFKRRRYLSGLLKVLTGQSTPILFIQNKLLNKRPNLTHHYSCIYALSK
jgi:hypothetical protein